MSGGYEDYGTTGGYNEDTCNMSGGYNEKIHAGIALDECKDNEYYAFNIIYNNSRDPTTRPSHPDY